MARGWEYAIIAEDSGQGKLEIRYAGPDRVAHHDAPAAALPQVLGALGGKDWELVSVTSSWQADGHHVTQYYFKRHHEGHDGGEELVEAVRAAAWSSGLVRNHAPHG
jgi:hypothetical protein